MQEEMMLVKLELEKYKQMTVYWETKARVAEHQRRDILIHAFNGHPEVPPRRFLNFIFSSF